MGNDTMSGKNTPRPQSEIQYKEVVENPMPAKPSQYTNPCLFSFFRTRDGLFIDRYIGKDKTVRIPCEVNGEPVIGISDAAFHLCYDLQSVTIPDSVIKLGRQVFWGNDHLSSIHVDSKNRCFLDIGGVLYSRNLSRLIACPPAGRSGHFVIPNGVKEIEEAAFAYCISISSISVPNSVSTIKASAFGGCRGLTSITLPDSVTDIGAMAFMGCDLLTKMKLPPEISRIEEHCFWMCKNLQSVYIPKGVTDVEEGAFDACDNLREAFYQGGRLGWHRIQIGEGNESLLTATIYYHSTELS